ncbi:MAG TPA: glycosyl hydrolase [Gemmatimonadales bacterium]
MRTLLRLAGAVLCLGAPLSLFAQTIDTTVYASLRWRNTGPLRGGRSVAAAGSQARPNEYWMGTTGGGVFKTTDGGESWTPVSDRHFGGTIGAIAVAESNPDIVYVGGGEFPIRGNTSHGDGVYKTTDGGRSWSYLGLVETRHIGKIRVHPRNPDVVYVAALGQVFGPSPERGIFKSTDGGRNWRRVLFRNDSTGAVDLSMDPNNPDVLYAGLWQAHRRPWQLVSGGAGSGLFKSTDGGEHWTEITRNPGLPPRGLVGNVGISVSPAQASRVYALIEHDSGGVFRSDDGGATWIKVNTERRLRQRAWYYTRIYADTRDPNTVYVSNVQFLKSTDGGRSWTPLRAPHGDSHDLWIAPENNQRMIESNDGGSNVTRDGGRSWTAQDYLTAQFYHVTTTNHFPYRICGAQQDNSTVCGTSRPTPPFRVGPVSDHGVADWYDAGGGESGYIAVRPDDPDIIFAGSYGGLLTRKDARTGFERNINAWPMNPMGHSAGDLKYRFQWTFPIMISPHDPNVLYVGANVLFRSTNEGDSFEAISPDLTRNDPSTLGPSGGPITRDQTSVEYYGTIFTISESPVERGVIWVGTDDGLVQVTRDGGKTWANVTPPDAREWTRISIIDASPHQKGAAYVAGNRYQMNDFRPYLWRTTDYGKNWTPIVSGIRPTDFTRVIREDPERAGLLFAGTERGVWVSFNDGAAWQSLQLNLPPVPIHDLAVRAGDVVLGSHGRSFFILDDISVLRQLGADKTEREAHLFEPRAAYAALGGAQISYWLKRGAQRVKLEFLDAKGAVIREFTSDSIVTGRPAPSREAEQARLDSLRNLGVLPATARPLAPPAAAPQPTGGFSGPPPPQRLPNAQGLNRFTWNLRYPDASRFEGLIMWAAGTAGPIAPPGTYSARLTVGDKTETVPLQLLKDPRSKASDADLQERFALALEIRDKTTEANDAVRTIRNVKGQLTQRQKEAGSRAGAVERLARPFTTELSAIEAEIYQVRNESSQDPLNFPIRLNNKIAALAGVVGSAEAKPTQQTREVFRILSDSLAIQTGRLKRSLDSSLPPINRELERLGLKAIVPSTAELAREERP